MWSCLTGLDAHIQTSTTWINTLTALEVVNSPNHFFSVDKNFFPSEIPRRADANVNAIEQKISKKRRT